MLRPCDTNMNRTSSQATQENPSVSVSISPFYRVAEERRITAGLLAGQSFLIVSGTGYGKSTLAKHVKSNLENRAFKVIQVDASTPTLMIYTICNQLTIDVTTLDGKRKSNAQLREEVATNLSRKDVILILDNAERYDIKFRVWVCELIEYGCPILVLATCPPRKDLFLKLPRIELKPLDDAAIREIMALEADRMSLPLKKGDLAHWQSRVAGNPMIAKRAIQEEYLGLSETQADHTQWIDGTPFLIAILSALTIVRFLGLGFNSTNLYLLGGILTVSVGVVRLIYYSLPKQSSRLGGQ